MKKSILSLLAVAAMVSCTQNDMDLKEVENQTPIMLGANALSVEASTRAPFEGNITSANTLNALVFASSTIDDYTTRYATGCMLFEDESTAVGYITDNTTSPAVAFSGKSYYPADGSKLYFAALYPAAMVTNGWSNPTTTSTFIFSGKEDIMAAPQVEGDKTVHAGSTTPTVVASTIPNFQFKHLLTKLNLKFVAVDQAAIDAWGKINKIELVKIGESDSKNTKVEVTLKTATASTNAGGFSLPQTTAFQCYGLTEDASNVKTYTDTPYAPAGGYVLTTTSTFQAYTIAAPTIADGSKDFTFRVYADGAADNAGQKYIDVDVDLKKGGTAFSGDTQGKAFDITLKFQAKTITATAAVTGWNTDDANNDDTVIE